MPISWGEGRFSTRSNAQRLRLTRSIQRIEQSRKRPSSTTSVPAQFSPDFSNSFVRLSEFRLASKTARMRCCFPCKKRSWARSVLRRKSSSAFIAGFSRLGDLYNFAGLRATIRPIFNLKFNLIALCEAPVSIRQYGAIVNEYVCPVIPPNEAVPFLIIEPLDDPLAPLLTHIHHHVSFGFRQVAQSS